MRRRRAPPPGSPSSHFPAESYTCPRELVAFTIPIACTAVRTLAFYLVIPSVGDPDPEDPHDFGPPGSGPLVRGMDPDPEPSLFS